MPEDDSRRNESDGLSRRDFLKIGGLAAAVPLVESPRVMEVGGAAVEVHGPGKTPVTLQVNGKRHKLEVEPRVTLLDALRSELDLTGAKRVCDRAACGACTVLLNGKAVYACAVLAVEADGAQITTVEGLTRNGGLHPVQQAFVDNDASQCGFCTPGFVVAAAALLEKYPHPTPEQFRSGLSGNFCRCGTYAGIHAAMAQASGRKGE